jgi:thiosulfate reductase cytochrome b subunit
MTGADRPATVTIHPGPVRATHWINAVAMVIMIGSGWRIWNSDPIFNFSFPTAITVGGDPAMSQDVHNELGLASALQWHFAGMWLLVVNGLVYVIYGVLSGLWRR